jgi:hypothetical protein
MMGGDWQFDKVVRRYLLVDTISPRIKSIELSFNGDLPDGHSTDMDERGRISDSLAGLFREFWVAAEPPEKRMCIQ